MQLDGGCVKAVNKAIGYLIGLAVELSPQGRGSTEVENDFYNAFRKDEFLVKSSKTLYLPEGVDQLLSERGLGLIKAASHFSK